jgi:hypothetical protein
VVRGVPADLSWRIGQTRVQYVSAAPRAVRRLTSTLIALLAAFNIWAGIGTLTAEGAGPTYTALLLAAAAMALLGLVVRTTAPLCSTLVLITAGAVPAVVFHWMAPVFLPVVVSISALAVATQPRPRLPRAPA